MSKFGLMLTIPHTGTHRIISLFGALSNQLERVGVGETGNSLIASLINGHMSEDIFVKIIKSLRMEYPDPPYVERDILPYVCGSKLSYNLPKLFDAKYKWLFYYSHLVPNRYESKLWPQNILDDLKLDLPILTPLRDPILTSVSIMLLTGDSSVNYNDFKAPEFKGVSPYIWWTIKEFNKLVHYKRTLSKVWFIPVDLYNHLYIEDRLIRSGKIIKDMGLVPNKEWETQVRMWRRYNPSKHDPDMLFHNHGALNEFVFMKDELEKGRPLPVKNDLIDYLIEVYKSMDGLQELFEAEGYRQLSWFK